MTDEKTLEESAPTEDTKPVMDLPALTLADRCDRCGAQAFVRTVMPGGGDLSWCGHHFSRHEEKLRSEALHIQDERNKINAKPSVSANAL